MSSDKTSQNHAQNHLSDDSDASDDNYPNIKENRHELAFRTFTDFTGGTEHLQNRKYCTIMMITDTIIARI